MRTHPDRPWRGVNPPIHSHHHNSSVHNSSDIEDDYDEVVVAHAIDMSKSSSLPRWQKTGKRGRKSTSVYDAAENLVLMSLRYNHFIAVMSMVVEPKSHQSSMIPCNRKNIHETSTSQKHVAKKIKFYLSDSLKLGNNINGCESYKVNRGEGNLVQSKGERILVNIDSDEEIENDSGSMKVEEAIQDHVGNFGERKKVMKLLVKKLKAPNAESETQKKVNGYVCDICWKSFPTFQGLRGHRSIHSKEDNNVMDMVESESSDYAIVNDATL
ncbi:hypothetical protein TanjilG_02761 [Lupinus angustifolius]|uniref:C2H2-type domain-containing protein n=2 Tax=Lupinus angustifolius TaxID=3871 RepID=A0A1J7GX58_LUPAN|nr:hypothetical protein TanjilG_02761 [Lupinus angustifolius]